jgi:hypothetical protein
MFMAVLISLDWSAKAKRADNRFAILQTLLLKSIREKG